MSSKVRIYHTEGDFMSRGQCYEYLNFLELILSL